MQRKSKLKIEFWEPLPQQLPPSYETQQIMVLSDSEPYDWNKHKYFNQGKVDLGNGGFKIVKHKLHK